MFTTRRLNVIAATAVTGVIATVGIVAAGASDGSATTGDNAPFALQAPHIDPEGPPATAIASPTAPTVPEPAPSVRVDPGPIGASTDDNSNASHVQSPESSPSQTPVGDTPESDSPAAPATTMPEPTSPDPELPIPIDPEGPSPDGAGTVSGTELAVAPPPPPPSGPSVKLASVPKDPPPPPPVPGPVDLAAPSEPEPIDDIVTPTDPTPIPSPGYLAPAPTPVVIGSITTGLTGCQLDCVTSALLSANGFNADVTLEVSATVEAHFEVKLEETYAAGSIFFNNPGYDTEWTTTLGPLKPETTYDLTLIAIDKDGHSQVYEHQFTTVAIIDGFASNALGCELECITVGTVDMTDQADTVRMHVETNTTAELQIWLSTSTPAWVDDPDLKPNHGPVYTGNASTGWTFDLGGLDTDTVYHVVARAFDQHGEHYRVGTFKTDPSPSATVLVTFEEINVTFDGDKGALNRGEITFSWGFDHSPIGHRAEQKMHAGQVPLDQFNFKWFIIDKQTGTIPTLAAQAGERDADAITEFCSMSWDTIVADEKFIESCDMKVNPARNAGPMSLNDVLALPKCVDVGFAGAGTEARCDYISSDTYGTRNDDYAHFGMLVSFVIE